MACTTPGPAPERREHVLRPRRRPPRLPGRRGRLRVCADPVEAGQDRGAHLRRIPAPGRGPGRGGLAQCEPSATRSTPPRTVRAQRDGIRPGSILASPPRTMRAEVTSPIRLPPGAGLGRRRRRRRGRRRPTPPGGAGARRRCPPYPWRIDRLPRERERAPGGGRLRDCAADFPGGGDPRRARTRRTPEPSSPRDSARNSKTVPAR